MVLWGRLSVCRLCLLLKVKNREKWKKGKKQPTNRHFLTSLALSSFFVSVTPADNDRQNRQTASDRGTDRPIFDSPSVLLALFTPSHVDLSAVVGRSNRQMTHHLLKRLASDLPLLLLAEGP